MSTKASAATPTVTGQAVAEFYSSNAMSLESPSKSAKAKSPNVTKSVVEDIDMKMTNAPKMKKQLSITTPTWDARAEAEVNEKDERRRQSEVFRKEITRQASLLGADLGTMSAMAMVADDDDSDDEIPMSSDMPTAVEEKPAMEKKPEKGRADSSNQKASSSSQAATMPSEEDQKESSPPDPLNGCYELSSQRTLGSGAYGVVSKVKCLKVAGNSRAKVGEIYALKKIRNVFRNRTDAKRILRELRILRAMRHHDCIVRVIDILIPTDLARFKDLYVMFELIDTDMSRVFNSDQSFKLLHVKYFLYQILRALKYMHSANLVHRDLKPANVLVNEDCSLRVADFGLSRCISEIPESLRGIFHNGKKMRKQLTEHMQTRWYRAPEVCMLEQRRDTQFAMDIWGAGCILGELLQMVVENQSDYTKRKPLFRGTWSYKHSPRHGKMDVSSSQIARIVEVLGTPEDDDLWFCSEKAKGLIAEIPHAKAQPMQAKFPGTPEEGIHLLQSMLRFDPRKRLDVDGCLSHPFLAEVRQPCDELKHQKVTFEFEDVDLQSSLIRELIIEEIAFYHPDVNAAQQKKVT